MSKSWKQAILWFGDHQYFEGYTLFLAKEHVTELHHMEAPVKLRFLEEMSLVQEAVSKVFSAQKMNVELLGNGDAHVHWHIFPRREGDMKGHGLNGRGPVWWVPWEEMVAEEYQVKGSKLEGLVETLSETLDQNDRNERINNEKKIPCIIRIASIDIGSLFARKASDFRNADFN